MVNDRARGERPGVARIRHSLRIASFLPLLVSLFACGDRSEPAVVEELPEITRRAVSTEGMVVSGSTPATEVGAAILGAGGNAADAAVAVALALAVTEPSQSGLGGRTQIVFRTPDGQVGGIDATTVVPASYDPATAPPGEQGHAAVGIPGTVAGLGRLHGEYGVLPWADVVAPALTLATVGFELPSGEAARWSASAEALATHASASALFLDDEGRAPAPGDVVVMPELGNVLQALAEDGPDVFYRGWIADSIAADQARNGGYVTRRDLASYEALDAVMARGRLGDLDLVGTWLPAGGATTIEALQILHAAGSSPDAGPASWAVALAGALTRAYADRDSVQDDDPTTAVAWITADSLARRHAADLGRADSLGDPGEPDHTTHVAVVDRDGFVVALTQSLGPQFGAMVATPSLGFLYASTLGGYLAESGPGTRAWSSQSPLIGLRGGAPVLTLGGGGGRRIISAAVSTVAHVGAGEALADALTAPRLHPTGGTVYVDGSWDPDVVPALESAGWTVEVRERNYFARLNAITRDSTGAWVGVADPVWTNGAASGPRRR